ncbi:MAG: methyltransferase [Rhodospirillales bacterium]|nr:methyltransferase [Rhodospirillales bacterium]
MRALVRSLALVATLASLPAIAANTPDPKLKALVDGPQRSVEFKARDVARKPLEALSWAGVKPGQTVVELWPAGGYWTEILAPYETGTGKYEAAVNSRTPASDRGKEALAKFTTKLQGLNDKAEIVEFNPQVEQLVAPGSADVVFNGRNLHNWMASGFAEKAMQLSYAALKPGGILILEDHRASTAKPQDPKAENGYVREDYAIALAEKAGFKLDKKSELYANPRDTKDYEKGVWTLPPTLALKDQDKAKYEAIGESDCFLLVFVKPKK